MNKKFIKAILIRCLKTFAESMLALIPAMIKISEVDWVTVVSTSALAAFLCLLTCIKGLPECEEGEE